jgi:hypothetical protein
MTADILTRPGGVGLSLGAVASDGDKVRLEVVSVTRTSSALTDRDVALRSTGPATALDRGSGPAGRGWAFLNRRGAEGRRGFVLVYSSESLRSLRLCGSEEDRLFCTRPAIALDRRSCPAGRSATSRSGGGFFEPQRTQRAQRMRRVVVLFYAAKSLRSFALSAVKKPTGRAGFR